MNKEDTDNHGWAELLPARIPKPAYLRNRRIPWAVIGAGVTGLAAARRLALLNPGDEIALLDARMVSQGASGRNSGFAVAVSHFSGGFKIKEINEYQRINRINQAGLSFLREQVKDFQLSCQWREQGFYHTAADENANKENQHFLTYLQALDIPHTSLKREELNHQLGTSHYLKGVQVHQGALLQPAALVQGLADHLPENTTLFEQSPVRRIDGSGPFQLRLDGGDLEVDRVIIATNFEAPTLGFLGSRLASSTLSGSFTRKLTDEELNSLGDVSDWGILSLHSGGATVRLTIDGRISIRNTAEFNHGRLLTDNELRLRQQIHRQAFDTRFPQLAKVPFEFGWSGVEAISRNGTNFFGQQKPGIFLAGGYNGSGVSRGTAFGTALAELACGGTGQLISDCLASPAATWIPPRPFLDIGAMWTVNSRFRGVGKDR